MVIGLVLVFGTTDRDCSFIKTNNKAASAPGQQHQTEQYLHRQMMLRIKTAHSEGIMRKKHFLVVRFTQEEQINMYGPASKYNVLVTLLHS